MTSKNLFLTSMLENFKRRTWLFALTTLFFVLYFPVGVLISNQSTMSYADRANTLWMDQIRDSLFSYLGFNFFIAFVMIACAFLCAMQGFGYLHSRQKVDFYHCLPVSKPRRFLIIYLNGLLAVILPYLVCLLLSLLATGLTSWSIAGELAGYALFTFFVNILLFLAVYSVAVIAVLLTGNKVIALLAFAALLFYEVFFRLILTGFMDTFFRSHSNFSNIFNKNFTSPVMLYFIKLNDFSYWGPDRIPTNISLGASTIVPMLLFTLVFTLISFWLHLKRPSESSGKAIAFPALKPPIKLLLMVPISAITGLLLYSITNVSIPFLLFGFFLGLVLSHAILEIIFEFDLRACLQHKRHLLIGGALTILFYLFFQFDLVRFDRYVPNPDKVESVAVVFGGSNQSYYDITSDYSRVNYYNGWMNYQFASSKVMDVEAVCGLADAAYEDYMAKKMEDWPEYSTSVELKYNMKNGREVYRSIYVNYKEQEEVLNRIFTTRGYKQGVYQIYQTELFTPEFLSSVKLSYSNGVSDKRIPAAKAAELLDIYREDLLRLSFTEQSSVLASGELLLHKGEITDGNYSSIYDADWNFPIYPSFLNTIAYLEENGLYLENYLNAEEVFRVTVSDYTAESMEGENYSTQAIYDDIKYYDNRDSNVRETDYTDRQQINALLPALYPQSLSSHSQFHVPLADNLSATVNLPRTGDEELQSAATQSDDQYSLEHITFQFLKDKIPDFIIQAGTSNNNASE